MKPLFNFSKPPRCAQVFVSYLVALCLSLLATAQVAVTTQHNDNSRTGQNLNETILNTSNVNANSFGKLFSRTVDGQIYAQPLYVPNLQFGSKSRNVVYVETANNSVFAFDADDANTSSALWHVNLGTPVPDTDISPFCIDIQPVIGIIGTPVIDTSTNAIYVVAKTKDLSNSTYHFKIHALDLVTGAEKFGGPTTIAGKVPGTGVGGSNGLVNFEALLHNNRPGLLLMNGTVYVAFGSTCDTRPWHGWIFGYNNTTLQRTSIYNTTPNGYAGGMWGGGEGLLGGSDNSIYFMTGNGTFDGNVAGSDYGDSVVKLNTDSGLTVSDYFTPSDQQFLNLFDVDLGSGGPMAIPDTNLIAAIGKDAILRLLDRTNMGQYHSTYNAVVQQFLATTPPFIAPYMGAPIYWNSPNYGPVLYIWGSGDVLRGYQFVNGKLNESPVLLSTTAGVVGYSNSVPLSLSANGNASGTGIVWAAGPYSGDANQKTVKGIVHAFDATNLTVELWNSRQNTSRDDVGNYAKFCPPTIANGKVYIATFSNKLLVYGLLNH
jgi:hypothetical protein